MGTVTRVSCNGMERNALVPAPEGLALRDLQNPDAPLTIVGVRDCARVTAIAASPGNDGFVTGGSHGQVDKWSWAWDGKWHSRRLRAAVMAKTSFTDCLPERIVAIVTLADSNQLVAVSAEAELLVFCANGEWQSERIPYRGSPRSLSAHPSRPWVAVGIKQGDFAKPKSVVGLFDVGT